MTNKEEVLRLCETVGIKFTNCRTLKEPLFLSNGSQKFEVFTALIDLAKQAEREECAKLCESKIICTNPSAPAFAHDGAIMKCARAIRNREQND